MKKLNITDEELEDLLQSGQSRIKNQIHWARMVLVKIGFIDSSQRGVWSLTEKGISAGFSKEDLIHLYQTQCLVWALIPNKGGQKGVGQKVKKKGSNLLLTH